MRQISLQKINLNGPESNSILSLALIFGFILLSILGLIILECEKKTLNSFSQFINDPNTIKQDIFEEILNDNDHEIEEPLITTSDGQTTRGGEEE